MENQQDLAIRGESVQRIYDHFINKKFLVNRKYQRKLVWTVEEKASFIDSLKQGFPIPLILIAQLKYREKIRYEIIDGMQRIDAITSFIEGDFHLNDRYFDLDTMAESKLLADQGKLRQKTPVLDRETCTNIASYVVPLSIYSFEGEDRIDEIFRRINTNGRHLSRQELRQAGVTGLFSQLVRTISSKIRGDVSHSDQLYLNSMKKISISNRNLRYGIKFFEIPWIKYKIISHNNIRESRDEELIAHILAAILLGKDVSPTAYTLDCLYGFSSDPNGPSDADIDDEIKKLGSDVIEKRFLTVYDELKKTLEAVSISGFDEWIFRRRRTKIAQHYQVLFLSFYELLVVQNKKIRDYRGLARKIQGIGDNTISIKRSGGAWDKQIRETNVNAVITQIRDLFIERLDDDPGFDTGITKLENLLIQSHTEQSLYDFKICFHRLDEQKKFDKNSFDKITKTLTAMANHGPGSVGYVIVGVAETEPDANRYEKIFGSKPIKYKNFFISGIQDEASGYENALDGYFQQIIQKIKGQPISPGSAIDQICRDIRLYRYYDKAVVVFQVKANSEPVMYDKQIYERHGPSLEPVDPRKYSDVYRRFSGTANST